MIRPDPVQRPRARLGRISSSLVALALAVAAAGACRTSEPPPPAEPEAAVPPGIETFPLEVVTATRLNVRAGPGTEHPVVGKLPQGAPVRVLEHTDGWKRIRPDEGGLEGWAAGEYLSPASSP